ncbi:MAG: aminotransferase class I/II-fold pyridoxal phosphate-dependent enzyme [Gammaproteobacteria bacterium]|nr:MAG: aminotransferase class I/II-fold pyridoxal phosphate-dependent enzyme [Gammaproteobacteria bacterium]
MSRLKIIDLRSDTVTKPDDAMRGVIMNAIVGDHGYEEDETTLELEKYCANLFNKEAALFMPSGTMSNQIAIRCYTNPGDEIILDASYHINYFEAGPTVDLGKVYLNLCNTDDGVLRISDIEKAFLNKHRSALYNYPTLICLENTINTYGGKIFPFEILKEIFEYSRDQQLPIHIDGARILNACAATGIAPQAYAAYCDSITICFSKGLGAPFGSILMGTQSLIANANKFRKWYGGGMHQSGFMAAAALHAIKHNISSLALDNNHAKLLALLLKDNHFLNVSPENVDTNIVMLDTSRLKVEAVDFIQMAKKEGLLLYPWSKYMARAVTHKNIDEIDIRNAAVIVNNITDNIQNQKLACNSRFMPDIVHYEKGSR